MEPVGILAGKNDGILGLRMIEVGDNEDVVHLLITPDCRRQALAECLQLPEVMKGTRSKVKGEPGHFIPIPAGMLEQTAWWHEEMAPKIRAVYFYKVQGAFR